MRILRRYLAREIIAGVALVLMGFLGLTAFYDLIQELDDIGRLAYRFQHAVAYVLLMMPGHVYELMPVAALIGSIYALARFASSSEFTAMRAAGMSRGQALRAIVGVGVLLALLTALAGEYIAPVSQQYGRRMRGELLGEGSGSALRSGFWIKDSLHDAAGAVSAIRFVNIGRLDARGALEEVAIHEFDAGLVLRSITHARRAAWQRGAAGANGGATGAGVAATTPATPATTTAQTTAATTTAATTTATTGTASTGTATTGTATTGTAPAPPGRAAPAATRGAPDGVWLLDGVERTVFTNETGPLGRAALSARFERLEHAPWQSELTPDILSVLAIEPDNMSVLGLWQYGRHLRENGQNADRYELSMWKKLVYPVAIVVMLVLALPFAYLQARAGSVGLKLFIGIMLGVVFFFMNGLSTNLGLLNTWPPWIAVSIPSIVALVIALVMLARVGRSH